MLEFRYDTQLLIEGENLDEDKKCEAMSRKQTINVPCVENLVFKIYPE